MGVLLLGIFTEFLSYVRRLARTHMKTLPALPQIFSMCFLYAVQLMFGYFCMLIAMTYQVIFLLLVVLLRESMQRLNLVVLKALPNMLLIPLSRPFP